MPTIAEILASNSAQEIEDAARDWIADCLWVDLDAEMLADLNSRAILRGVELHYSGGLEQFLADSCIENLH